MLSHPDENLKRSLAAYYTPPILSTILTNYLIRNENDTILEPSFGGGVFLREAIRKLKDLGNLKPQKNLFGCDIDHHAFDHLPSYVGAKFASSQRRFVLGNFLETDKNSFLVEKFDCILANPPFIGYGKINSSQRKLIAEIADDFGIKGSRYAGLWFYFVLKSLNYLDKGGRVAFVLPHGFIDNNYSSSLKKLIADNFKQHLIISFPNRIFADQGTKERVSILVAEGWGDRTEKSLNKAVYVENIGELEARLESLRTGQNHVNRHLKCSFGRVDGALTNSDVSFINRTIAQSCVIPLGSIVDVKIGLVTGDAGFFCLNKSTIDALGLNRDEHFIPIIRSMKGDRGLAFTKSDMTSQINQGSDCFLLAYEDDFLNNKNYLDYISSYDSDQLKKNKTFSKRDIWCEVSDNFVPDIFINYMSIRGPRAMLNSFGAQCINNTHRGYFKKNIALYKKKLICISLLSTFTKTLVELDAKVYGNKMLKMEPGLYSRLAILFPQKIKVRLVNECFKDIDACLRAGLTDRATSLADDLLFTICFPGEAELVKSRMKEINLMLSARRKKT